jgi:hypothetical protein
MWDKDAIGFGTTYTPGSELSDENPEQFSAPKQCPNLPEEGRKHRRNSSRQTKPSDFLRFQSSVIPLEKEHIDPAMFETMASRPAF